MDSTAPQEQRGTARETWTVTGPQVVELDDVRRLEAGVVDGRLDVVVHDGPGVRVEVHAVDGRPVELRLDGDRLRVGHSVGLGGWARWVVGIADLMGRARADVHVAVPADVAVRLSTVRGEGLVAGTRQGVTVSTVSGSVLTSRTAGRLEGSTVTGDLTVRDHEGPLRLDTVSGEVTASGSADEVDLSSVSGDVTLDLATQPSRVETSTVSGDLLLRVPDPDALECRISCVSGRVLVAGVEERAPRGAATTRAARHPAPGGAPSRLTVSAVSGNVTVLGGDAATGVRTDAGTGVVADVVALVTDALRGR